jgi:hypothetical protein
LNFVANSVKFASPQIRAKIKNAKEISEKISVFRDEKHRNLSATESNFFGQFSTIFTESEQNKISANSVEQIKYLAAVVQFVKRKIRGNFKFQIISKNSS